MDNAPFGKNNISPNDLERKDRRTAIRKIIGATGMAIGANFIPLRWTQPVIDSVILPAHAQTSETIPTCTDNALSCSIDGGVLFTLVGISTYDWDIPITVNATSNCNADFTGASVTVRARIELLGGIVFQFEDRFLLDASGNYSGSLTITTAGQNPALGYSLLLIYVFTDQSQFGTATISCSISAAL